MCTSTETRPSAHSRRCPLAGPRPGRTAVRPAQKHRRGPFRFLYNAITHKRQAGRRSGEPQLRKQGLLCQGVATALGVACTVLLIPTPTFPQPRTDGSFLNVLFVAPRDTDLVHQSGSRLQGDIGIQVLAARFQASIFRATKINPAGTWLPQVLRPRERAPKLALSSRCWGPCPLRNAEFLRCFPHLLGAAGRSGILRGSLQPCVLESFPQIPQSSLRLVLPGLALQCPPLQGWGVLLPCRSEEVWVPRVLEERRVCTTALPEKKHLPPDTEKPRY